MPVKNAAPYLEECLTSIISQDFEDWELIAVNDHSRDNSASLVQAWQARDNRIKLFQNRSRGIIPALQQAYQVAQGSYVSRMDSDDLMPPGRLSSWMKAFTQDTRPRIMTGLVQYFSRESVSPGYQKYQAWLNSVCLENKHQEARFRECGLASPNWVMPRALLESLNAFNHLKYPEDYHLYLRWTQAAVPIQTLNQVTLLWREHPQRTSRNSVHYQQEAFFRLKINFWLEEVCQSSGTIFLLGAGRKVKLTEKLLNKSSVSFHRLRLQKGGDQHIKKQDWQKLVDSKQPLVLVGVYPEHQERERIRQALNHLGLQEGVSYWFL